jgi:hypothetical protein
MLSRVFGAATVCTRAGWSADEGEDFAAEGGHDVVAGCFDVEAEQRLGVGGSQVVPRGEGP